MKQCERCGATIEEGVKTCPSCGDVMGSASAEQSEESTRDAEDNKVMAIIAYLLFFIPLLVGATKESDFVKFHTNQGSLVFLLFGALGVIYSILRRIFATFFLVKWTGLGIYGILMSFLGLIWLIPAMLVILGIVNAATGKAKELPVIGRFRIFE